MKSIGRVASSAAATATAAAASSSTSPPAKTRRTEQKKSPQKKTSSRRRSPSPPSSSTSTKLPQLGVAFKDYVRSAEALASLATKKTEASIWDSVAPFTRRSSSSAFKQDEMLKIISWNVAGLRGVLRKDDKALEKLVLKEQPDVLCLQETKLNPADVEANRTLGEVPGYVFVDHVSELKKGYSGTRVYLHKKRMESHLNAVVTEGFTLPSPTPSPSKQKDAASKETRGSDKVLWPKDEEGRVQTVWLRGQLPICSSDSSAKKSRSRSPSPSSSSAKELSIAIVNSYVVNSGMTLERLPYRVDVFDAAMRSYLSDAQLLCAKEGSSAPSNAAPRGIIWTGDLNVADRDYDRYYAGTYGKMQVCSGFTPEERLSFRQTLGHLGAVDAFRTLYPNAGPTYTFWSARIRGREKGLGWRLDYFVVSKELMPRVVDVFPMPEVESSDHCPIQMWLRTTPEE